MIPGHGRVGEQNEVVDYRDMVVLIRDVIADLTKQGKTVEQVKAAHPALPYKKHDGDAWLSPHSHACGHAGSWTVAVRPTPPCALSAPSLFSLEYV